MKSKALLLLIAFVFNILAGMSCALGLEGRLDQEEHFHATSNLDKGHDHSDLDRQKTPSILGLDISLEDFCCEILVNELMAQHSLLVKSLKLNVPLSFVYPVQYPYAFLLILAKVELNQNFYLDQRYRPPNKAVRVMIQSFQI